MCASDKLRIFAAAAAIMVAGCSDDLVKVPSPNQSPDTFVTSDSPRPREETSYQVRINWNGSDRDGRITGYYIAWDDTVSGGHTRIVRQGDDSRFHPPFDCNTTTKTDLLITPGDSVVWYNDDSSTHTTTSGSGCVPDGIWDSGPMGPGASYGRRFNDVGVFPYFSTSHCHEGMIGRIIVQPPWTFTTSSESTFVVCADSCSNPPCEGEEEAFFDYHTFWVKSVDDQEANDPTPAFRTFTATTVAPEVTITIGPFSLCGGVCDLNSDYVFVEWRGNDPDGQIAGYWYKWNPDSLREYPALHGPDPSENGWVFLPPESTSIASRQQQLNPPGCSPRANSFAVYAVDDAGAIQQVGQCGVNWTCFCPDSTSGGPGLCIDGKVLGTRSTPGDDCDALTGDRGVHDFNRYGFDVVSGSFRGTPNGFQWIRLKADRTPAPLVGYRYAIDDPTGFTPLSKTRVSLPDSIYAVGSHTLYVEAVDRAGIVDAGTLRWVVSPGPKYRPTPVPKRILIVDDNGHTGDVYYSEWREVQARERANWDSLLAGFHYDYWDTQDHVSAPLVPTVGEYTTLVWSTGIPTASSTTVTSFLRDQLFKPRAEYLSSYIRAGGNVVIVGMNPMFCMVIRSPGVEGGDLCEQSPAKGIWMFWDPALCGLDPDEAYPHFLFTRLGIRQMKLPQAPAEDTGAWEEIADRMVRGCTPVNPSGTFNRYLGVDSLRAGGDTPPHLHNIPAANVTIAGSLESWATPIYYMDTADTTAFQNILGIVAIGDQNPRKPPSDPSWGNTTFLSVNPYFIKVDDARWFFRTVLTEVCAEEYNP